MKFNKRNCMDVGEVIHLLSRISWLPFIYLNMNVTLKSCAFEEKI